jgi:CBS domain-containing protein
MLLQQEERSMTLRDVMSNQVVRIHPEETVTVAARMLEHYNIGALPVCGNDGRVCGMVTDRDIVTRCLAAQKRPDNTAVKDVMTSKVIVGRPDMQANIAAALMGREQIRRLPVMENGRLCGMVSLGDLAVKEESSIDAGEALTGISSHLSSR